MATGEPWLVAVERHNQLFRPEGVVDLLDNPPTQRADGLSPELYLTPRRVHRLRDHSRALPFKASEPWPGLACAT